MEQTILSEQDGVVIKSDIENNRYVVELPNSYDVYWKFNDKNIAERLTSENKKIAVFAVPTDKLDGKGMDKFDEMVSEARKVNRDTKLEREDTENILGFDLAKEGKTVSFVYRNPVKGFCVGEIVKTGNYYVAQKVGETEDKIYVRMINTGRLLNGKEDYENREQAIAERFPVGSTKYLSFTDNGKIVAKDYKPKIQKTDFMKEAEQLPDSEKRYERTVRHFENQGMTRSDAQGVVDAQELARKIAESVNKTSPEISNQQYSKEQQLEHRMKN